MASAVESAIEQWRRAGIPLLPPDEEAAVIAALNQLGRKYSRDVVALYSATGGMKDWESDSHSWSLWPLARLLSENPHYDCPHILFADFLINSHLYCFRYENDGSASVCIEYSDGDEPRRVAGSVEEFFEIYLRSPLDLEMFE